MALRIVYGYLKYPTHSVAVIVDTDDELQSLERARVIAGPEFSTVTSKQLTWIEANLVGDNSNLFEKILSTEDINQRFLRNRKAARRDDDFKRGGSNKHYRGRG